MNIGYSRPMGTVMTVLGALVLGLNLFVGNLIGLIPGVVCVVVGVSYLSRPYFRIDPDAIVIKAPLGPMERRYPYDSAADIKVENHKIWVKGKKLGLSRTIADTAQWDAAVARLCANSFD